MKKKLLTFVLSGLSAIACTLGLAACGGKGDDAEKNEDFASYKKKVVSILQDNGIDVNDTSASKSKSAAKVAYANSDGNKLIKDTVLADAGRTDATGSIISMRDDLFEQSLYISLYVGDALVTDFNQKTIYDIPVKIDFGADTQQYFKIIKKDNLDYVLAYVPDFYANKDFYVSACVDYTSQTNYSYTFLQYTEDMSEALYAHGNSQKEFYCVSYSESDSHDEYLYYASDDQRGWMSLGDSQKCLNAVKSEFSKFAVGDIKANVNFKHTITQEMFIKLSEKYFGGSGSEKVLGAVYATNSYGNDMLLNGKKILTRYWAENKSTLKLPTDGQYYLAYDFRVEDYSGKVTELVIPENVSGIAYPAKEDGAVYDENYYAVGTADRLRLSLDYIADNRSDAAVFGKITVEENSPVFKSGTGHLKDKNGNTVYYADYPTEMLDLNEKAETLIQFSHLYTAIWDSVTTVNLDIAAQFSCQEIMMRLTALTTVNVTDKNNGQSGYDVILCFNNEVTVNIEIESTDAEYWRASRIELVASNINNARATVNFNRVCPIPDIRLDSNAKPSVIINTCMSQLNYQATFGRLPYSGDDSVQINYGGEQGESDFEFAWTDDYGLKAGLKLSQSFTSKEITVPATFGKFTVESFLLDANIIAERELKLTISDGVRIEFTAPQEGLTFDNRLFVLCTKFSYDEFMNALGADYYNTIDVDMTFTAQCSDKTDIVQLGLKYNPDAVSVSVEYNGITKSVYTDPYGGDTAMIDLTSSFNLDFGLYYILTDGEKVYLQLNWEGEVRFNVPRQSASFKLYGYSTQIQSYNLTGEDYEFTFVIQFSKEDEPKALVTDGTIGGCPISQESFNGEIEMFDGDGIVRGIAIDILMENFIWVDFGNAIGFYGVTVRFFPDDEYGWKPVFETPIKRMVDVTLTDGTHIEVARYFYEKMPFDETAWKIEDGYVYFLMCTNDEGITFRRDIYVTDGYLNMTEDVVSIEVKRIVKFDSISAQIEQDDVSLTVDVTMKDESNFRFAISGTALGFSVNYNNSVVFGSTHFQGWADCNNNGGVFARIIIDFDFEITEEGNLIITNAVITKERV